MPSEPVTLTPKQVNDLNQKLSDMRHDVNNFLSLVVAAAEVIRFKPETSEDMLQKITGQSPKIIGAIAQFSRDFEQTFGITRNQVDS